MSAEQAPCALCLSIDEIGSMLDVTIEETPTRDAFRRALCVDCVVAIGEAMGRSERWGDAGGQGDDLAHVARGDGADRALPPSGDLNGDAASAAEAISPEAPLESSNGAPEAESAAAASDQESVVKEKRGKRPLFSSSTSHKK